MVEEEIHKTLQCISEKIEKMTKEEFLDSLKRTGIIDENNKLTEIYRRGTK